MELNPKTILGIGFATGIVASAAITLGIHNARKIRKFKEECNQNPKKKKTRKSTKK